MNVQLDDIIVTKIGDSNQGENCDLYGANAAVIVKDGSVATITNSSISSAALGANAVYSYGGTTKGKDGTRVDISDTTIVTSGNNSGGVMSSSGGQTNSIDVTVTTSGEFSSPIKAYNGGGEMLISRGNYTSNGANSPAVYGVGNLTINKSNLISNLSEGVCVTERSKVELNDSTITANNVVKKFHGMYSSSVMLYDKDASKKLKGSNIFKMTGGTINNTEGHVIHVTNTSAKVTLDGVAINDAHDPGVLISVTNDGWSGHDNEAVLELKNMPNLTGSIICDKSSTEFSSGDSKLDIALSKGTIYTGCINSDIDEENRGSVSMIVGKDCRFILTETSYIDSLENNGRVICGDYKLFVNGIEYDDGGPDYPTESILTLSGTDYELDDPYNKVEVVKDKVTSAITITIKDSGHFTLKGSGINDIIKIKKNVKNVILYLSNLTIDNTNYSIITTKDDPVLSIGDNCEVNMMCVGENNFIGSSTYITEPQSIISTTNSMLQFTGSGTTTIKDSIPVDHVFDDLIRPDGIKNEGGVTSFVSGLIRFIVVNGNAVNNTFGTINMIGSNIEIMHAGNSGLYAADGIINIRSGILDLQKTLGNGIDASINGDDSRGNVVISGGTLRSSKVYGDCIKGENIIISGGDLQINTQFATSAEQYYTLGNNVLQKNTIFPLDNKKITRINYYTGYHTGIKAGRRAMTYTFKDKSTSHVQAASGSFTMTGGKVSIDTSLAGLKSNIVTTQGYVECSSHQYMIGSPCDGICSFNTVSISGGQLEIKASANGISADGSITISGESKINIVDCYEGIEGSSVTIGNVGWDIGPDIHISCNDDGINSATKSYTYVYDDSRYLDYNYTKTAESYSTGSDVHIYSGKVVVDVDSESDKVVSLYTGSETSYSKKDVHYKAIGNAVDCNGSLYIHQGDVSLFGANEKNCLPVETSDIFVCNLFATVLIAGIATKDQSRPYYGNCVFLMPSQKFGADSVFKVKTRGGETVYQNTLPRYGTFIFFSNSSLTEGLSYPVTIGNGEYLVKAFSPEN